MSKSEIDWQPIETAPKDGTEVLLVALLDIGLCYWSDKMQCWTWGQGKAFLNPSHWMPLPQPPETRKADPTPSTPSSKWKEQCEPDPHGNSYDCERTALCMGHLTDDELANAVFLHYDTWPPLQDIIDGKAFSPIAYVTAAKERIRWLSRALERATKDAARWNFDLETHEYADYARRCPEVGLMPMSFEAYKTKANAVIDAAMSKESK